MGFKRYVQGVANLLGTLVFTITNLIGIYLISSKVKIESVKTISHHLLADIQNRFFTQTFVALLFK